MVPEGLIADGDFVDVRQLKLLRLGLRCLTTKLPVGLATCFGQLSDPCLVLLHFGGEQLSGLGLQGSGRLLVIEAREWLR